ncbi:APC family permease [Devriesea agamarum]|uniref:APC family permease n=1 Tax=Devriesea agamarum TaxID=472569 RepID=UPI000B275DAE|nr:APC family permease [Devriesea agamarum]
MSLVNKRTSTAMAAEQNRYLKKTLGRLDILFLIIAAVVGLEMLGSVSALGPQTFTWCLVLVLFFLVPYALIFAETGGAFIGEGGVYLWVREAFGRPLASVASILTWVTQPVWVGGSMAFLASETIDQYLIPVSHGSVGDYAVKLSYIWITVFFAVVSMNKAKWVPNLGAVLKIVFLGFFVLTAVLYLILKGPQTLSLGSLTPTLTGFFAVVPLLLFSFLGFEAPNSASGEMKNATKDVSISVLRACAIAAVCYLIPIAAILWVLPAEKIDGVDGLMNAVREVFSVYGPVQEPMLAAMALILVAITVCHGASWMLVSDRMQAIAAADGAFFGGFFGRFHRSLGTPVRVNVLSGVVATAFLVAAMSVHGTSATLFNIVLNISISTFLLSYLIIIPAVIRLRYSRPDVPRSFKAPVSNLGFMALGGLCLAWVLVGSWTTVFPGTIEHMLGLPYDFHGTWKVERGTFEALTLGTLAVITVLALVGYVLGTPLRRAHPLSASPAPR